MDREAKGKDSIGTVSIKAKVTDIDIVFSFTDDGQGLQLKEIAQKAKEAGLIDNIHSASPSELLNFIFRDNFSTSPNINDISGRGTGLAAVKHAVKQMDGRIKVRSHQGRGTVFIINIPRIRLLNKELAL
jgi:chemotaxis protein histidine kinase CheA